MFLHIQRDSLSASTWVVTHPPQLPPAAVDAWMNEVLAVTPPEGGRCTWSDPVELVTDLGWRCTRLDGQVVDVDGVVIEYRVAALYAFPPFVAAIVLVDRELDASAVAAVLRSVRPDWTGDEPAAISELWRS